jgi:hypothetical protein
MGTKKNPIRIRENRQEAKEFIRELDEKYLGALKAVCHRLKFMGIDNFPLSAVTDCISGNFDQVSALYSPIIEAEKSKAESDVVKNSIEATMSQRFNELRDLVSRAFSGVIRNDEYQQHQVQNLDEIKPIRSRNISIPMTSPSLFQLIELNDQMEPVLSDEAKQKVFDVFADISSPAQEAIIEAQTQAAKYLTEMSDALIANGQRHDMEVIMNLARKFFTVKMDEKTGRYEVIPNTETIALL